MQRILPTLVVTATLGWPGATRAHAARECEDTSYRPAVGACARLATADLFYLEARPTTGRRPQTVIFLHATSGNADAFEHQLETFARAGYRAIAYDRKNVGRSSNVLRDAEAGRVVGTTVQDLDDLATYIGVERFHLVGVAAGAQVVLQYAAKHPKRVLSVVLAATLGPPGLAANEPTLAGLQANIALPYEVFCTGPVPSPLPAPLRLANPSARNIPEVRAEHRELGTTFRATDREGVRRFHEIEANARHRTSDGCRSTDIGANQPGLSATDPHNPNTYERLRSLIAARTLLLAGTGDVFFSPPVHMKLWGQHIRAARFVAIEAGHAPQFENPSDFNDRVLRFLKNPSSFERLAPR